METKFYTLNQNNSGGYYIQNKNVDAFVIIEASDIEQFGEKTDKILNDYREYCSCCGQRWNDSWIDKEDGTDEPTIYGEPVEQFKDSFWCRGSKVIIYYLNGDKKIYNLETRVYE